MGSAVDEIAIAVAVTTYLGVAAVIMRARPGHRVGRLTMFGAAAWGAGEVALALGIHGAVTDPGSVPAAAWLGATGTALRGLGWLVLVVAVPLVFPDGDLPWRRRWPAYVAVAAIGTFVAASFLAPTPLDYRLEGVDSPTGLPASLLLVADALALTGLALTVAALVVAVAGLVHRWRVGDELRRQQLLWLSVAFAVPVLFLPFIGTDLVAPWMFAVVTMPVPVALAVAMLQRRLYDVQLAVSTTLTYVSLSAVVAGLYALTVGGVGALLRERGATWLPWVAAGVVAVSFAPLRNVLQQWVNRLTYGAWSQPAAVLAATGRRLADAADVHGLLRTLVAELGSGLRLDHVTVADEGGRVLASYGAATGRDEERTLTAYAGPVGTLRWGGRRLRDADRALLDDVAHQLGGVVHAASLLDTIRDAQERLVLAQEEERRRLRRDLHDGLGPALAGLSLRVDTLRNRIREGGLDIDHHLLDLRTAIQATVVDVRRVVEGLRPPAIDELGLADALVQLADRSNTDGLEVAVDVAPLPEVPAAVEVAIYRVTQEALANVAKHGRARHACVSVVVDDAAVTTTVSDDGCGTAAPRRGGVGLVSMRERAAQIGGTLHLDSRPGHGTTVTMRLPR